jgi:hypothetical protein
MDEWDQLEEKERAAYLAWQRHLIFETAKDLDKSEHDEVGRRPRLIVTEGRVLCTLAGWKRLADAFGVEDVEFVKHLVQQAAEAVAVGNSIDEDALDFVISFVVEGKAKSGMEAALLTQMAVGQTLSAELACQARNARLARDIAIRETSANGLAKLNRTYVSQLETLKRLRSGGEQKVTVQHVSVADGGQAIVGNVTHRQRKARRKKVQTLTHSPSLAMPPLEQSEAMEIPVGASKREHKSRAARQKK